jgi:hypothetical protein
MTLKSAYYKLSHSEARVEQYRILKEKAFKVPRIRRPLTLTKPNKNEKVKTCPGVRELHGSIVRVDPVSSGECVF